MEVSGPPKLGLLELLVVNCFIGEWHDTQVGFGREKAPSRLEEHVARNYISLKHSLVEQKRPQRLADDHVDGLEGDFVRRDVLNFALDHLHHVLKPVGFYQYASDFSSAARLTCIDLFGPSLRSK